MKKLRFLTSIFSLCVFMSVVAQTPAENMSPFGYGASATGGAGGTVIEVTNVSQLQSALHNRKDARIIWVTQDITFTTLMKAKDLANVTILGKPGVRFITNDQTSTNSGCIMITRGQNVIIRNIIFEGPGAYDCDGNDLLCFEGVTNAWVDHCDFSDGCDGNFDNKNVTDNVTVSWCKFHYNKPPRAGGSGGSADHRFTNLLGSSSSDKPSDGTYSMTWAYCWWGEGCKERMLRMRNADIHFLGCYWNSSVANYYIGPENAKAYVELCTFEGKPSSSNVFKSYGGTNAFKAVNSYGKNGLPANSGSPTVPSTKYSYTSYASAAEAKTAVTNADCGAGATLDITYSAGTFTIRSGCSTPKTEYTITFNKNGGSGTMAAQQGYEDAKTTLNACSFTAPSGKAFAGWNTAANGSGTAYADQGEVILTSNITLYAQWATSYTVTYSSNGHGTAPTAVTVGSGAKLSEPVAPTADGWIFGGWYKEAGCTNAWDFETETVTSNRTLYAKWTEKRCEEQVWYTYPGDLPSGVSQATCFSFASTPSGSSSCDVTLTIDGTDYNATHRGSDWNSTFTFTVPSGKTGVLYVCAKSSGSTRTLTLTNGGGTISIPNTFGAYESQSLDPGTYTVSTNGNIHIAILGLQLCGSTPVVPEVKTKYTVSFNANGHGTAPDAQQVEENSRAEEPVAPVASGYTFGGWFKDAECTNPWSFSSDLVTADITLYAKWVTAVSGRVTVSFNTNGHGAAPADQSVVIGGHATEPATPVASGYMFVGWYDNEDCVGDSWDFASDEVRVDMTLYAKWKKDCDCISISVE